MFLVSNLQALMPYPAILTFSLPPPLKKKELPSFSLCSLSISSIPHFSTAFNTSLLWIPLSCRHFNPWVAPFLLPSIPASPTGNMLKVSSLTKVMSLSYLTFHSIKLTLSNALVTSKLVNWLPPNSDGRVLLPLFASILQVV